MCHRVTLVVTAQNDFLKLCHGVCVSKGASMGPPHILEVLHPATKVAVLKKVRSDLNSFVVFELIVCVAHGLSKQKVRPGKSDIRF